MGWKVKDVIVISEGGPSQGAEQQHSAPSQEEAPPDTPYNTIPQSSGPNTANTTTTKGHTNSSNKPQPDHQDTETANPFYDIGTQQPPGSSNPAAPSSSQQVQSPSRQPAHANQSNQLSNKRTAADERPTKKQRVSRTATQDAQQTANTSEHPNPAAAGSQKDRPRVKAKRTGTKTTAAAASAAAAGEDTEMYWTAAAAPSQAPDIVDMLDLGTLLLYMPDEELMDWYSNRIQMIGQVDSQIEREEQQFKTFKCSQRDRTRVEVVEYVKEGVRRLLQQA